MKHKSYRFSGLVALLSALAVGCGGDSGSGPGSSNTNSEYPGPGFAGIENPAQHHTYLNGGSTPTANGPAQVTVLLTDAPNPTIDSAVVTISEVTLHQTGGGWVSALHQEITLDLMNLQGGITEMLGQVQMEAGKVTQIRLVVTQGEVVSGGQTYDVEVPSGEIKLNTPFDVCAGGAIELTLDFDAQRSLRYNPGKDNYRLQPVVKIDSVQQDCPAATGDDDDDFTGPTGWLSIVLPPVDVAAFQSADATVDDVQVHDQGIGQVTTLTETYQANLLESDRQISDATTGSSLYTVLLPPIEVPAGDLDQVRLFLQTLDLTAMDGRSVSIRLPDDSEGGDGLKFFGAITVCEDALTILQWDLVLDAASVDWNDPDGVIVLHPVIQNPHVLVSCQPITDPPGGGDQTPLVTAGDYDDGGNTGTTTEPGDYDDDDNGADQGHENGGDDSGAGEPD